MASNTSLGRSPFLPLLLIAPFFLWGTAMVAMKGTLPHTTPFFMAGVRLVPAGALILLAAAWMKRPQPQGWMAWLWIGLFGLVDGALFQGFLSQGLTRTGAGLGSVMIDSQPLAVALMARWFFGERIGIWGGLGLALGILGISLLGLPDEWLVNLWQSGLQDVSVASWPEALGNLFQSGQWLMLMAALSMAVGTVMVRWVCRYADPVTATGWHMILGGLPLFALSSGLETQQWSLLDGGDWLSLSYATIFGSAIAYGLFFYFASSGNLTSFSSLTFLTPVFALVFGNLFLSEVLSSIQWAGVGFTLMSIYLINQRDVLTTKIRLGRWLQVKQLSEEPTADLAIAQPQEQEHPR
ncbi:MAG TPA: DMT family transporter [Candidatus Obscuribacterales bacterium]